MSSTKEGSGDEAVSTVASFEQGQSVAVGVGVHHDAARKVPLSEANVTEYTNALANPVVSSYPGGRVKFLHNE